MSSADRNTSEPKTDAPEPGTEGAQGRYRSALVGSLRPWLILILVCTLFSLHPDFRGTFWTRSYLSDILQQSARNIVLAVGMSFVIFTGGIDLSVGSVLALCGVAAAMALTGQPTFPFWLALVAAFPISALAAHLLNPARKRTNPNVRWLAFGVLFLAIEAGVGIAVFRVLAGGVKVEGALLVCVLIGISSGLLNGLIISVGKVPPFVMTLGLMSAARGLTLYATGSQSVLVPFERFRALGEGVPLIVITLGVVAAGAVFLTRFTAGRYVLAIGGNEQAARLTGIPIVTYKTLAYVLSGLCAAIGAILVTAKFGTANTGAGTGAELEAIAAVVIGGASLSGGQGSIIGALVGALTITVITNGLVLVGIEPNLQQVILGAVIVLTVFADQIRRHSR